MEENNNISRSVQSEFKVNTSIYKDVNYKKNIYRKLIISCVDKILNDNNTNDIENIFNITEEHYNYDFGNEFEFVKLRATINYMINFKK